MFTRRVSKRPRTSLGALLLIAFVSGCLETASPSAEQPLPSSAQAGSGAAAYAGLDYQDIEPPPGFVEPDLEGAVFPLSPDDPRAQLEIDPDTLVDDGFTLAPMLGDVVEKTRIGAENRTAVTNTRVHPQRTSVLVLATFSFGTKLCTGTMVGSDAVLTAAHCTFDLGTQRWATSVRSAPGAYPNGSGGYIAPYGTSSGRRLFAHDNYRTRPAPERLGYDFGMVRLNSALGSSSGTRTVGSSASPTGNIEYYGYQGDLVKYQMYKGPGRVLGWEYQQYTVFKTDVDCFAGASGSGLASSGNTTTVFGVLTGELPTYNTAIAFDIAKRDKVRSWITMAL